MVTPQQPIEPVPVQPQPPAQPSTATERRAAARRITELRREVKGIPHPDVVRHKAAGLREQLLQKQRELQAAQRQVRQRRGVDGDIQLIRTAKVGTIERAIARIQANLQEQEELLPRAQRAIQIRREFGMKEPAVPAKTARAVQRASFFDRLLPPIEPQPPTRQKAAPRKRPRQQVRTRWW